MEGWRQERLGSRGRNSQGGREEQKHPYKKKKRKNRKTHLTHTGLLMEESRHRGRIASGLSLALIGNASGRKASRESGHRSEAFSIRRQGGSRWRLRQMRGYGD